MDSKQLRERFAQAAAAATQASKRAAASFEDAARKAAPHLEEAAAKAAAHIEKARPHLEEAAKKTRAAAKEVQKRIDRAEPGRDAVKRLLGGVLKDWLDGDIDWIDEDRSEAETTPTGASIAVSLRKGEIELRRVKLKARSLDTVGAPGLYLVSGSIDHARFVLPWTRLGAKPVKVEIRGVALQVREMKDGDAIATAAEASAAERRRELDLLEAARAHWTALAEQTGETKETSLGRRLLAKLASRVAVDITDVSVSFGDIKASATHIWARDDERASPRRVVGAVVGISLSVGERIVLGPVDADATADARSLVPNTRPPPEGFPAIGPPPKGRAAWVVRLRCDALHVDGPVVCVETALDAIDAIKIAATRVALRDFAAPKPVAANAKAWWRRAYAYAARECKKGHDQDRWASALRLLRMRRAYVPLYARDRAPPRLRATFPRLSGAEVNRLADLEAVAPTLAILAFRDAARDVLRARDNEAVDDVHSAARKAAAALGVSFQPAPPALAEAKCTSLCCVLVDVGFKSARCDVERLALRLDVDKEGGHRWTGAARGADGTEFVRVEAFEAGINAAAAPLDLRLLAGDANCVPRIAAVARRITALLPTGPAPSIDAVMAGLRVDDVLVAGRVAFKDGILSAESISCGASDVNGLRVDFGGHAASATAAKLAWTPALLDAVGLLPAAGGPTDAWSVAVDDASVEWPIPGGAAEVRVKSLTVAGTSTDWVLGCRRAALSVSGDAPVRLTEPVTCALRVADELVLTFGPLALQARPAETAALIRCVCAVDALASTARADLALRISSPKIAVATVPDRASWGLSRNLDAIADVRLDDAVELGSEPVAFVVEGVDVCVMSSTATLAVTATARTASIATCLAIVSDISLRVTDSDVIVQAARTDVEIDDRALSATIEVASAVQTGFSCRAWDNLGVSRAVVEGEAVDFFAVETEQAVAVNFDAISISWNGVQFRGHVTSDGVTCTAVLEAARNRQQLLEPTLVTVSAAGVSLINAIDAGASLDVYAAPADIQALVDAAADLTVAGDGTFAVRAGAVRFVAMGGRVPAFRAEASDVCLDGRRGTTALTGSLTRLDAYDAASQTYRSVLQTPCAVCAQFTDGTLRVALGDVGLAIDDATVASLARLLAARETGDAPPLHVRNETGATLIVDGVAVDANAVTTLRFGGEPRGDRLGQARDGAPLAPLEVSADAYAASLPLDRRAIYGPWDGLRPAGAVAASEFLVGEYTYGPRGAPTLRLRTRIRVENRCDREMALQVAGEAYQQDMPPVAPGVTLDLPLAIATAAPDAAALCVLCDERWRPVASLAQLRATRQRGSERVRAAAWSEASARCFIVAAAAANTIVVCPPIAVRSSLTVRARVATARRRPESREDYAENCVVPPNAAETAALYDTAATHWSLRVDGVEAQSAWVDVSGVAARGEEVAFVVDDGRRRLRVTLHRIARTPSLLLVLRCGLIVEDRAGLGVGVIDRVATDARTMVDGGKHAALQLSNQDGVSPHIVPGQLVNGRGATTLGERPVGLILEDRTLAVVPLVVVSSSLPAYHVMVRHVGVATRDEPLPVHALQFDISINGADASSGWFGVNATSLEPGNIVRRFGAVELVVGPRSKDACHSLLVRARRADAAAAGLDVHVECASTSVRVADLDVRIPRGWCLSKIGAKWALDVHAVTVLDGPHTTLTSTSAYFLRVACRVDRKLSARVLPGDCRITLRERCARRCLSTASFMRRAWESEQVVGEVSMPETWVIDLVRCGRFVVAPLSLVPDAEARVELAHALEEESGVLGWAMSLLSSFPRLAVVDAELDFTGEDLRPVTPLTVGGVLGEVAACYGEQVKQSWWSIATSLSLGGGAPSRPPPQRRVTVTVPAADAKLGFSVTFVAGRLVVTAVGPRSALALRGVGPGARLLRLNGEDVAHCSPSELSARAASLVGVERVIVLAVDDVAPHGGASF